MKTRSLTGLINEHLRRPNTSVQDLGAELKDLSYDDKVWYARAFIEEGHAEAVTFKNKQEPVTIS